jgi:hypothetical protein
MGKDVEAFFMYLLAICTSENCQLSPLACLSIVLVVLFMFNFLSSLYIPDSNPSSGE